jgi:3D (Asp-Asp-Asp) domain-containing protein
MKAPLALLGLLAVPCIAVTMLAAVLQADSTSACSTSSGGATGGPPGSGAWTATAYGPPWGGIQGNGITATGLDLTAGQPALVIAVDPRVIPLGSYVYVMPNPFGTRQPFLAADTGGAIHGHHIDIYDWRGRQDQNAWGTRPVTVTPAPAPGASNNLLGGVAPIPSGTEASTQAGTGADGAEASCAAGLGDSSLTPTSGQTARVLPDGSATTPAQAPQAVRRAIAAGNLIHTLPYPEPDTHYGTLAQIWPAYDCSGATSFVLYAAGLLRTTALDSTGLESYGQPGPGHWITIYANSAHTWIVIAGIALDTAEYGGPPIPAGSGPRWRSEPLANLQDGTTYVVRHPAGL